MCMGVATANSILMVSFAREQMDEGMPAFKAAVAAGYTRVRPVLMTALAMIIGMVPMALGFGEGGEQNTPLGRAVIGGLVFATLATLFFVPSVFTIFHGRRGGQTSTGTQRLEDRWLAAILEIGVKMSGDDKTKQTPASQPERGNDPDYGRHDGDHTEHLTRAQIDEEIAAMEQHSRRQTQTLEPPPELPPAPPRRALVIVGLVLLVLLIAGAATLIGRRSQERALAKETERSTIPTVAIVHPQAETPDEELVLPGSLLAFAESPIYARTSGYLVRWYKDIGTRVNGGDLLATIDAPEVDQELNQTRAARQQIVAQLELAKSSAERWENLRKSDSVSAQEADQQTSAYSRRRRIWRPPMRTCAVWSNWRISKKSTHHSPV